MILFIIGMFVGSAIGSSIVILMVMASKGEK